MKELSTVTYTDNAAKLAVYCYADTFVFNEHSEDTRELVAMRFGGYAEHVRAMSDAVRMGVAVQADVDNHPLILKVKQKYFKRSVTHNGIYAEGMVMVLDYDIDAKTEEEKKEDKKDKTRKMYIFCKEGDTDELFAELDRKTAIPLIPDFKDYILSECMKRGMLVQLKVVSANARFDAYQLELRNDEQDMEAIVNGGLKMGRISIPNSVQVVTVAFVGHRTVKDRELVKRRVHQIVEDMILTQNAKRFLFGSKSKFDDLCYEVVTELKRNYPHIERIYVRAEFPYIDESYRNYLLESYEDTYYPAGMEEAGRAAYVERNCKMIDKSDVCVIYYDENYLPPTRRHSRRDLFDYQPKSGTRIAYEYTVRKNKKIINVAEYEE